MFIYLIFCLIFVSLLFHLHPIHHILSHHIYKCCSQTFWSLQSFLLLNFTTFTPILISKSSDKVKLFVFITVWGKTLEQEIECNLFEIMILWTIMRREGPDPTSGARSQGHPEIKALQFSADFCFICGSTWIHFL